MPEVDAFTLENVNKAPAPRRGGRIRLFLIIFFFILLVTAAITIGALFFLGVIPFGEPTPTPDIEPTQIRTIAEYNACAAATAAFPDRFCYDEQVETDATWSNSTLLEADRIDENMAFSAVFIPGTNWIVAEDPRQPIEKVFYLPEGDTVDYTNFHIQIALTHPLETITLNGETFTQGENFDYPVDNIPFGLGIYLSRLNPDGSSPIQFVNVPDLLLPGRNVIRFQFADADAILDPEATPDPETGSPLPLYALLAEIRVPTTAEFNSLVRMQVYTDERWLDAPYAGFLPESDPDTMDGAHWIQGGEFVPIVETPDLAATPDPEATPEPAAIPEPEEVPAFSVEHIFYVTENSVSYVLDIDIQEATLSEIIITNASGEETVLGRDRIREGTTIDDTVPSFQRYEDIPFAGATSPGLNRLSIVYAPNSNSSHYVRARLSNRDGTVAITDDSWLRGNYRLNPEITDTIILPAQEAHGFTRMGAYLAIPGIVDGASPPGEVTLTCIFVDVLCENVSLIYQNETLNFDENDMIIISQPERLFWFDLLFAGDILEEEPATLGLQLQYSDGDELIDLNNTAVWYAYRPVRIVEEPPGNWARIEDSAFMQSTGDNSAGAYISVFERQFFLPQNAVVVQSGFNLVVADNIIALYINGERAYAPEDALARSGSNEVNQILVDGALLRGGDNRIVIYSYNNGDTHGTSFSANLTYFSLESLSPGS